VAHILEVVAISGSVLEVPVKGLVRVTAYAKDPQISWTIVASIAVHMVHIKQPTKEPAFK
jgi:hypothetical protein